MTKKESDQHTKKREAALRANLMKRKAQARARENMHEDNSEKTLNNPTTPAKD